MKLLSLIVLVFNLGCVFGWLDTLEVYDNLDYQQLVDNLEYITDSTIFKRDQNSTLDAIISSVGNSGIVTDLLSEIASSDAQINTLVNLTTALLKGASVDLQGFNISLNVSSLLQQVLASQLIQLTAGYLLLNNTNNDILANRTGYFLSHYIYVGHILNNLGAGQPLSVQMIADTVKNSKNLNPRTNGSSSTPSKQAIFGIELNSRQDTSGSAQAFLSNLINGVISSQLVSSNLQAILYSLNRTQVVGPIAMEIIQNDTILSMFPKLIGGLYNNGALDNIDLNKYFQEAKRTSLLSNGLQLLLDSPTWDPAVGRLLHTMESNGVFKDIEDGLYGPNK